MGVVRSITNAPVVHLSRIGEIHTFEVMENELDTLDRIVSEENQALAFASGAGTTFVSLLATVLTLSALSPIRAAVMAALLAVSGLATLVFGVQWLRVRRERPKLLARIRTRGLRPEPQA